MTGGLSEEALARLMRCPSCYSSDVAIMVRESSARGRRGAHRLRCSQQTQGPTSDALPGMRARVDAPSNGRHGPAGHGRRNRSAHSGRGKKPDVARGPCQHRQEHEQQRPPEERPIGGSPRRPLAVYCRAERAARQSSDSSCSRMQAAHPCVIVRPAGSRQIAPAQRCRHAAECPSTSAFNMTPTGERVSVVRRDQNRASDLRWQRRQHRSRAPRLDGCGCGTLRPCRRAQRNEARERHRQPVNQ